uniref:BHLH domain-containing protein n=1 Tax=Ananas comosus var. bracteatus TaxID=296719 RepID=A0A6V7P9N0_ANACO|nr:unnamed protein product [Ananas comosus var. bracteatus]
MDNFIDPFLSSSSWVGNATSLEAYAGNERNSSEFMTPSSHIVVNGSAEDLKIHEHNRTSSIFTNGNIKYELDKSLFSGGVESNSTPVSFGLELDMPHSGVAISSSIESNGSEFSAFPQSLTDAHSISSPSVMWPSSYVNISSLILQRKPQTFGLQELENDNILRNTCDENGKFSQLENLPLRFIHDKNEFHSSHLPSFTAGPQVQFTNGGSQTQEQEQIGVHKLHMPSFASGPQMTFSNTGLAQNSQQLTQSIEGNTSKLHINHSSNSQSQLAPVNENGCNGAVKPRVRARRGQATDPHSIAERLRREKIAERMKNLQELVPNSNKTDKASMLDEIIDYVKFLQLQVKVLSMSRLGATGAVVPLLTDSQAECSGNLLISSPSISATGPDFADSQDTSSLEQEVVELMESNVTNAMQYLQNKGLCLMPIALAAAISNQKGSNSSAIPPKEGNQA